MSLTVFATPACTQCALTRRVLERAGVAYTTVDLSVDLDAHRLVTRTLGYRSAPVVYAVYQDGRVKHWSGFQPQKLENYVAAMGGAAA